MRTGELRNIIKIATITETLASGDVTEVVSPVVTVRAKVTQLDGTRYLTAAELVDKAVFEIKTWDNNYSHNIRILYGDLVLTPIRPITRNRSNGSKLYEMTILAASKMGPFKSRVETEISGDEEMKYLQTVNLTGGAVTTVTTTLTTEPYNIEFIDSSGNVITTGLTAVSLALVGTVYVISIYNGGSTLTNVKLKILY